MQRIHSHHLSRGKLAVASMIVGGLMCGTAAHADSYSWSPSGGGDFLDGANWSPAGGPPGAADTAIFDNEATGTVTLGADHSLTQISFRNDSGTLVLDLGGNTLSLVAGNGFVVGSNAAHVNDVTVTNGTIQFNPTGNGILWSTANIQNNKLTITGAGTLLTGTSTSSSLIGTGAGAAGNVLTIQDGAVVSMANNFLIGPVSTTATTNEINVINAELHVTNGNRGIALQSGTLNITNSTVSTGYLGAATDAQVPTYGGKFNFNSGSLSARHVRMIGNNVFYIGDGGAIDADFRMAFSGSTVSAPNGIYVRSNGSIGGAGTITGNITGDAGARFGNSLSGPTDTATTTVNGDFDASNFTITLRLGDFPTKLANDQAASEPFSPPFEQLLVNGLFTHPSAIVIDLADYVAPEDQDYEIKVIGWASASGTPVAPTFINGGSLDYEYRSDGLYLFTVIPEPAALSILALGLGLCSGRRFRSR